MKKKILAIILMATLTISVLTGCSHNPDGSIWSVSTYTYDDHEFLVFTSGQGICVKEISD